MPKSVRTTRSAQKPVVRLDVAVDDPRVVCLGECVKHGGADLRHPPHGQSALLADRCGQGLSADELHHDDGGAVVLHDVVDGDDPGMAEGDRRAGLAGEASEQRASVPIVQPRREGDLLDGDLAPEELPVETPPDPAHAALADPFDKLVPPGDEFGVLLGHAPYCRTCSDDDVTIENMHAGRLERTQAGRAGPPQSNLDLGNSSPSPPTAPPSWPTKSSTASAPSTPGTSIPTDPPHGADH